MKESHSGVRRPARATAFLALAALVAGSPIDARERPLFQAQGGCDLAAAAARIWAEDAYLVYVENDDDLDATGAAERWGYLYYSPAKDEARAYSIRDRRILVAENLDMKYEAPPLPAGWIDSGAALQAADQGPGRAFRRDHGGRPSTMLLTRGAFQDQDPDLVTWTVVYAGQDGPSLFVMVGAADGKVKRTWRG